MVHRLNPWFSFAPTEYEPSLRKGDCSIFPDQADHSLLSHGIDVNRAREAQKSTLQNHSLEATSLEKAKFKVRRIPPVPEVLSYGVTGRI